MRAWRRRGSRSGFTLIELTTVCGIMATLAGQSGSAFLQVQNKALGVQCISQLQQINQAIQITTEENDGRLPVAWFFPFKRDPADPENLGKLDPADPYNIVNIVAGRNVGLRKLFVCPAAPDTWKQLGITYVYNDTVGGKLLDSLPNPAATWLMMDANIMSPQQFAAPHVGGYNVLFCDGHIKWVPQAAMAAIWRIPGAAPQPARSPAAGDDE